MCFITLTHGITISNTISHPILGILHIAKCGSISMENVFLHNEIEFTFTNIYVGAAVYLF